MPVYAMVGIGIGLCCLIGGVIAIVVMKKNGTFNK